MVSHRDIIVVGTSLGGVEALQVLAAGLPFDLQASIFIVIHLPAGRHTYIADVVARAGPLPVRLAADMDPIEPGQLLIAPPDHHLLLGEGHVRVLHGPLENGHRPAVNPLFRTAAEVYGPRVIGCVLTGALDCGTAGLVTIKQRGGLAVVQDPAEAAAPDMPSSALAAVAADHVVRLEQLGPLLVELSRLDNPPKPA